jgi:hypothetical protein
MPELRLSKARPTLPEGYQFPTHRPEAERQPIGTTVYVAGTLYQLTARDMWTVWDYRGPVRGT